MQAIALQFAGALAILVAVIHGVISETHVFASATVEPPRWRRLFHLIWHVSTVDWIAYGALLIAAPLVMTGAALTAVTLGGIAIYGYAAIGNAVATRGRHFGWMLMAVIVALLLASVVV